MAVWITRGNVCRGGKFVDGADAAKKKEEDVHQLLMVALAASLASLPACAVRQVESTPPTVTYAYSAEEDYDDIEARADLYCEEEYDADAVLVDRDAEDDGYKVVFACR
jgi:hypothetical protein